MSQRVLLFGENMQFINEVQDIVGGLNYTMRIIKDIDDLETLEQGYNPSVVVVDFNGDRVLLKNFYDTVWKKFKQAKIVIVFSGKLPFEVEELGTRRLSMGFVQRPFEMDLLLDYLLEFAPVVIPGNNMNLKYLAPVRLSDIRADEKFKFDLFFYMPANKKCLLYRKKDSTMSQSQLQKFQDFNIHDLFVRKTDLKVFNECATKRLRAVFGNKEIPATERRTLLQKKVKDLFGSFFDAGSVDPKRNKVILNTCKQVTGQLISEMSSNTKIYDQILQFTSQLHSNYSHSVNVSVYASLFSMIVGNDDLESASIGGMLHDIGLASLPLAVVKQKINDMNAVDKKVYESHPEEGLKLLKDKKILGSETVYSVITQHHELMDGTGYPKGLTKDKIHLIVKICQIADEFDELTSLQNDPAVTMSPRDALTHMANHNLSSKGGEKFDLNLLQQLKDAFCSPEKHINDIEKTKEKFNTPVVLPDGELDQDLKRRKRIKRPA